MTDDTKKTEEAEQPEQAVAEPEPEVAPVEAAVKEKKPKAKAKSSAKAKAEAAKEEEAQAAAAAAPIASLMAYVQSQNLKSELPDFRPGDTIRVHQKVTEGGRERVQVFEGVVIKRGGRGVAHTFTVRRIAHAVGVERTFLIHSPRVERIEVKRRGKVRRARLFYLRERVGARATRIKEVR